MGQDQSTQQGGGLKPQTTTTTATTANNNNNIQNHTDPSSNNSSPRPNRQQGLLNFTTLDSSTSTSSASLAVADPLANVPKAFHNDDEVLAIWRQLESIQLPYPILRSTGMNPDQEVSSLVQQMNLISENSSTSAFSSSSTNNANINNNNTSGRESSPTLESISKYISELKRKAQSASKELMNNTTSPNLRDRTTEVKNRLQKPAGATTTPSASPAPSTATSRAGSPQAATTSVTDSHHSAGLPDDDAAAQQQQQQQPPHLLLTAGPLPAFAPGPLLQALGRPQTLCLKEISNAAVPRCERMVVDAVKLAQELQSLKSGALQQIRHGQKCYSVETEVKRLHVELHGADRASATAKSIGHDGPFPPLLGVCEDTAVLLDKIHALLGEGPRRRLQEYAAGIDARSLVVKSPLMSPVKTKK